MMPRARGGGETPAGARSERGAPDRAADDAGGPGDDRLADRTLEEVAESFRRGSDVAPELPDAVHRLLRRRLVDLTDKEVAYAVARGVCLPVLVRRVLARVEADPLASAGWFAGDLLRSLMEVPGGFWGRYPGLYDRYREGLRAGAAARRRLPAEERLGFWDPIPELGAE